MKNNIYIYSVINKTMTTIECHKMVKYSEHSLGKNASPRLVNSANQQDQMEDLK